MSSDINPGQPSLLSLVICRIYHEDMLLAQRTYNFLMMQAVLAAALTFSVSAPPQTLRIFLPYIIAPFGLVLAMLQAAFGRRSHATIGFWRAYLHTIEKDSGMDFDHLQTDFFSTGNATLTQYNGCIKYSGTKPIFETFPWKRNLIPGANVLVGLVIPWLVAVFWLLFISALVLDTFPRSNVWGLMVCGRALTIRGLALVGIGLLTLLIAWKGFRPWPPAKAEFQSKPESPMKT